jgi:hypothetical protein
MSRGDTKPWLFGTFFMNSAGGRSSRYQWPGSRRAGMAPERALAAEAT